MGISDKEFNDIIEALSRVWRKSFAEALRDLCNEAEIEFRLILNSEDKKKILGVVLGKPEAESIIPPDKISKIKDWIEAKRWRRKIDTG